MGAQQSRQEPLVFYGESDVALKFSHDFVNQLQRNNQSSSVSHEHKSESVNPAEIDQIVEKRVSQELKKIRSSLAVEQEKKRPSTKIIEQDLEKLAEKNKVNEKPLAPEIEERQNNLISCYKNKQGQPLDCWKEVELFKQSVEKARKEFVANHL